MRLIAVWFIATGVFALGPIAANADPLLSNETAIAGPDENVEEDRLADGDIDVEDREVLHREGPVGTPDVQGESWISLVGLRRELPSGKNDLGAMVVVGLALDRLAGGSARPAADPPRLDPKARPTPARPPGDFPPSLARDCVQAAFRSSGLGADDARIDAIVDRARTSALLPETRLRAMRRWDDANHTTTLATTDGTNYYDAVGANLALEVRLTWRLDRLVYAGDEPSLERVRLERLDARSHLASRTLEALFAWERARIDTREPAADAHEEAEAELRLSQSRATLDVLTGGWFSDWLAGQATVQSAIEAREAAGDAVDAAGADRAHGTHGTHGTHAPHRTDGAEASKDEASRSP